MVRGLRDERGVSTVVLILVVVVLVAAIGGGLFLVLGRKGGEKPVVKQPYELGEFTTNLADPGGKRMIQTKVEVEVDSAKAVQELGKQASAVQSAVLAVLRAKTSAEVEGAAGMTAVGDDIKRVVSGFLTTGQVLEVNFLSFVTQ